MPDLEPLSTAALPSEIGRDRTTETRSRETTDNDAIGSLIGTSLPLS